MAKFLVSTVANVSQIVYVLSDSDDSAPEVLAAPNLPSRPDSLTKAVTKRQRGDENSLEMRWERFKRPKDVPVA